MAIHASIPHTTSKPPDCLAPGILRFIRQQSRYLVRQLRLAHLSREDVEQELLIDLWQRWDRFDATRSQERTFVRRVVRNKMVELVRYHNRKKRGGRAVSLDQVLQQRNDNESGDDVSGDAPYVESAAEPAIELAIDVATIVDAMPDDLRLLCDRLENFSRCDIRRDLGLSKRVLQQQIRQLRDRFSAAGMHREF
jgi:RNA polymerase sigma factor (sigma-70 family)